MATFTLQIVFSFIFIAPRFMQCTNSSKVKCTHNYSRNTCYSHSYLISHALCCTYKMSKYWLKGPIKYEDTWKPVFGHKKHVNFQKGTPPGGLEPPTFRLTAERASRLRHGGPLRLRQFHPWNWPEKMCFPVSRWKVCLCTAQEQHTHNNPIWSSG